MSRQLKVKSKAQMTSLECAYKGLLDLEFKEHELVLNLDEPVQVRGYKGHVRLGHDVNLYITPAGLNRYCRSEYNRGGASNGAGFYNDENGVTILSVSEYDKRVGIIDSDAWGLKLKQRHDVHKAINSAMKFGFKLKSEKQKGGKTILELTRGGGW